jgi:hypothetical protein
MEKYVFRTGAEVGLELGQAANGLGPAEDLLDPLAAALADGVARAMRLSTRVLRVFPVLVTWPSMAMCGVTCRARSARTKSTTS